MEGRWDRLQAAAAPALSDLERTRPGCFRLERGDEKGSDAWLWDTEAGSGTGLWLRISETEPWGESVLELTEQVQEVAMEILWRPWPECPRHQNGHPLEPDYSAGQVAWTCPSSGDPVALVGGLAL